MLCGPAMMLTGTLLSLGALSIGMFSGWFIPLFLGRAGLPPPLSGRLYVRHGGTAHEAADKQD